MQIVSMIGDTLYTIAGMAWQIFWALVLGFAVSGAVQTFIPKRRMVQVMGDDSAGSISRAGFFGAISSSCSYAAAAMARSVFLRGAHPIAAVVFMIAATNLVVELGFVLWSLMGWPFVVAEFVGGIILIAIVTFLMKAVGPVAGFKRLREQAGEDGSDDDTNVPSMTSKDGWAQAASAFVMDWSMIWKDIAIGVIVAGAIVVWVPDIFWQALFLAGGDGVTWLQRIENALVGPLVAVLSFVCSVGNVPMAAALFNGGITFGGAIAFIYGDLIVVPMLLVYRRYYGTRLTVALGLILYVAMAITGFIVDLLFMTLGWVPDAAASKIGEMHFFAIDYTFWLNLIFAVVGAALWWLSGQTEHDAHCAHHG